MKHRNAETLIRQAFKYFNRFLVLNWRLGLGRLWNVWPTVMGRYMVLIHTGRKSGLRRRTPINYAPVNGDIYVTAGFGAVSDWYRNLKNNPQIEIWLPNGRWSAYASEVPNDDLRRLKLLREVLIGSGFVAPLIGLDPRRVDDTQLAVATNDYRLIRIRRGAAISGPGGPGDLAWIWLLLALVAGWWIRHFYPRIAASIAVCRSR